MSTLEKRALWGLIIGVVWAVVFFSVFFALGGVEVPRENTKGITGAIVVTGTICHVIMYISYRKCAKADERDRLILLRAADMQLGAIILTVGGWCAALGQIYKSQGHLDTGYLYLIVVSMVIVSMIIQAAGILFWSRRTEYLDKI